MIAIVAAVAKNGVIGSDGDLPWRLPSDLKLFKRLTADNIVVMGRKTWDSLPNAPLPNRYSCVVTTSIENVRSTKDPNQKSWSAYTSLKDAITSARGYHSIFFRDDKFCDTFIIGGGTIYKQALEQLLITDMFITHVDCDVEGDVLFPAIDESEWDVETLPIQSIEGVDEYPFTVKHYKKKR